MNKRTVTALLAAALAAAIVPQEARAMNPITNCTATRCMVDFQNDTGSILPNMNFYTPYTSTSNVTNQASCMIKRKFGTLTNFI